MQQIEAAAAQTRTAGFDHRECRRYRHRRIEGIAARRQNFLARLARQWIGTGDGRLVRNRAARGERALRRQRRGRALNGAESSASAAGGAATMAATSAATKTPVMAARGAVR